MRWRQNVGQAIQDHSITRCLSRQLSRAGSAASYRVEEDRANGDVASGQAEGVAAGGASAASSRGGDGPSEEGAPAAGAGAARPTLSRHARSMGPDGEASGELDGGGQRHAMRRALSDVTGFEA